jgi:hypothetical protein
VSALLPLMAADLLLFGGLGVAVLAWLPMPWRARLLPGVPALGAASTLVALHVTSLIVGVRVGTVIVLVVATAALIVRSIRCKWWTGLQRGSWILLIAAVVAGGASLTFVSKPFRAAGPTVFGSANDAFYYVSVTDWLLDHRALAAPVKGVDPPAYGLTSQTQRQGLRLGEEMDEGAVAAVTGRDPINTWSTTALMWLFLLPGACIAAYEALELSRVAGVLAGVVAAGSAVVVTQLLDQNSAGLLGILVAPLAITLWARYFHGPERPPTWLVALVIDGLVGAYTEYLPLIGVGMLAYALLRPPRQWARVTAQGVKLAAVAVAIGPLIWYNALRSLALTSTLGSASNNSAPNSPFLGVPVGTWVARVTGTTAYGASSHMTLGLIIAVLVVAGVAMAMAWSHARLILGCIVVNFLAVTLLLGSRFHYFSYGEFRAVGTGLSLVLLASVAGWAAFVERMARSTRRRAWVAAAAAAGFAAVALFVYADQRTVAGEAATNWSETTVSQDFENAVAWEARVDPHGGSNVTALLPDYFTQLWSMYTLRTLPQTNFPFLYPDYAAVPPLTYDDGRLRRYILLGGQLFGHLDPSAIVGENAHYRYVDTSRGTVLLAVGVENAELPQPTPSGVQQWMGDGGRILVAHTTNLRAVTLTLRANPALVSVPLTITVDGAVRLKVVVGIPDITVTVPLDASTISVIGIENHVPARALAPSDLRPVSVAVESVGES